MVAKCPVGLSGLAAIGLGLMLSAAPTLQARAQEPVPLAPGAGSASAAGASAAGPLQGPAAPGGPEQRRGRIVVAVTDQMGGVIQRAAVTITRQGGDPAVEPPLALATNGVGVAVTGELPEGRYTVQVEFPGFQAAVVRDVRVRDGDTRRRITLQIQKLDESVTVGRDRQSSSLDPGGSAFSTVLTREQIDALPDDPEEMEAALKAMAPAGSVIRVDGFTGGRLPSKSQIRSIRLPRMDMFAAQNHGGMMGMMFIDVMTGPGSGPLRGNVDFNFLDDAFNARNVFAAAKPAEQLRRYAFGLFGTISPNKTSFSLTGGGGYQFTSPNLLAMLPDGTRANETMRQPRNSFNVSGRVDHSINKDHAARLSVDYDRSNARNLGVGGYSLFDQAFDTESSSAVIRLTENGPVGRRLFTESRLQVRWSDSRSRSAVEAPAIRVIDAFTSGGAQQRGGQRSVTFELASDLDYVRGAHSWRTGVLAEGGRYASDDISNYLGTYTFASLADYRAGRPSTYTRRIGDPEVSYASVNAAAYLQDDYRVSRGVLLSGGVRYGVQNRVTDRWNLSPRVTAAWSPRRSGNLTLRAGYGYFYDWVGGDLYKQTLLVDGVRQRELNLRDPAYPDPGAGLVAPPTNRYLWSDDLELPSAHRFNLGLERTLTQNSRVMANYMRGWGRGLLRGRNLNVPLDGVRPNPAVANDIALAADASSRSQSLTVSWNFSKLNWRRTFLMANYTWAKSDSNTTGAFGLPASGDDLSTEWGPAQGDIRHRLGGSLNTAPFRNLSLGLNLRGQSGLPYNITTGRDDNGDGVFNDRPSGVSRNAARGAWQWDLGGRVSYAVGFGKPRQASGGAGGQMVIRVEGGGGLAPGFGGGAEDKRYRLEFYASGQNLLNRVNYTGYSFVRTSPFYAQPVAALQPRKIQVGVRFGF